jgi:cysteine desulfurase
MSDSFSASNGIYLDYFATTPVDPRVLEFYCRVLKENFANPSSVDHDLGTKAAHLVKASRHKIADLLQCDPGEIVFTSGATESTSLFLQGFVAGVSSRGKHKPKVISSPVEHPSVLENLQALLHAGRIELQLLSVDADGRIDLAELEERLKGSADLVCVMAVNNETGNIYPTEKIAELTAAQRAIYFCDATQAIGKIPFSLANHPDTVVVFSGHKFYAPKGIGVLIADRELPIKPLFFGGGQQRALRPGTLNAPLIATLAYALEIAVAEQAAEAEHIAKLRDNLQQQLLAHYPHAVINGDRANRVAGALHVSLPGTQNKQLVSNLRRHLAISTGAACSSGSERPSHVLRAMHLPPERIESALRISLGRFTTAEEITGALRLLIGYTSNRAVTAHTAC